MPIKFLQGERLLKKQFYKAVLEHSVFGLSFLRKPISDWGDLKICIGLDNKNRQERKHSKHMLIKLWKVRSLL